MNNIIDYVKNNSSDTFRERPLTDIDSLVFSQLSYVFFDSFINDTFVFNVTLENILASDNYSNLYKGIRVPKQNKRLLEAAAQSKRFSKVKIGYYINEVDKEAEKQFSAITFKLDKKLYYVAFRGTDNSFIGWKEDLNMSFMPLVPAQKDAVSYFDKLAHKFPRALFVMGGHSKGGNIAVYTGVFCTRKNQKKIISIYNHDGPGFKEGVLDYTSHDRIKHCISKTMPQSSIIGMLLQQHEPYKVVVSNGFTIMQHDPFTWGTNCFDFNYTNDITDLSKNSGLIIQNWLEHTDDETKKVFIDALFSLLLNTNANTFIELLTGFKENVPSILNSIKTTDSNVRETVTGTLYKLIKIIASEIKKNTSYKLANIRIPRILQRSEK